MWNVDERDIDGTWGVTIALMGIEACETLRRSTSLCLWLRVEAERVEGSRGGDRVWILELVWLDHDPLGIRFTEPWRDWDGLSPGEDSRARFGVR